MLATLKRIRQKRKIRSRLQSLRIWITQEPSREESRSLYRDYLVTIEVHTNSGERLIQQSVCPAISELAARREAHQLYRYARWINVLAIREI